MEVSFSVRGVAYLDPQIIHKKWTGLLQPNDMAGGLPWLRVVRVSRYVFVSRLSTKTSRRFASGFYCPPVHMEPDVSGRRCLFRGAPLVGFHVIGRASVFYCRLILFHRPPATGHQRSLAQSAYILLGNWSHFLHGEWVWPPFLAWANPIFDTPTSGHTICLEHTFVCNF